MSKTTDFSVELRTLYDYLVWQIEMGVDEVIGDSSSDCRISDVKTLQRDSFSQTSFPATESPVFEKISGVKTERSVFEIYRSQGGGGRTEDKGISEAESLAKAAKTLEELEEALTKFTACSLKNTAKNTVFADGVRDPQLMVIGEAPGAEEDRTGRPFVGPAGQLLDKMLASIGFCRTETVRISNVIPWRPPGNRTPTPIEAALCKPFILRHIELAAPSIIFLAGAVAAQTLLGRTEGITRLRGRWFELSFPSQAKSVPALAGFHPAYLLRLPKAKKQAWSDLCLLFQKIIEIKSEV